VVKFLIAKGVLADRLAAAGFGEYQPLAEAATCTADGACPQPPHRTEADRAHASHAIHTTWPFMGRPISPPYPGEPRLG
jgi:hypothetical protein